MEGSGDRGVTITLSPSPGLYPLMDWNLQVGLLLSDYMYGDTITGMVNRLQHVQAFIENSEVIGHLLCSITQLLKSLNQILHLFQQYL